MTDTTDDLSPRDRYGRPQPWLITHGCGHPGKPPVREACARCRAPKPKGTLGKYREPLCPGSGQASAISINRQREDIDYGCAVCGYPCRGRTVTPHIRREPRDPRSAAHWLADTLVEVVDDYQRRVQAEREDH